ncbi:hypothetical protein FACS1894206_09390 [Deltaproteobacteria bacterium]|nr:hypothetical protein FACS1894206_09390 [Deltaproteobacteria bacterium]
MGAEHDRELVWRAMDLYCNERETFKEIARKLSVAASTLKRWAVTYEWRLEREKVEQHRLDIRRGTLFARAKMLSRLMEAEEAKDAAQMAYAVTGLERLALEQEKTALAAREKHAAALAEKAERVPVTPLPALAQSDLTDEGRRELLTKAVNAQISLLLTGAVDDLPSRMREIKAALDILASITGKDAEQNNFTITFAPAAAGTENA